MHAVSKTGILTEWDYKNVLNIQIILFLLYCFVSVLASYGCLGASLFTCKARNSSYLHTSPFRSWTHTLVGTCSCNSQECFGRGHCHRAICLPSTHQCLEATVRRQKIYILKHSTVTDDDLFLFFSHSSAWHRLFEAKTHSLLPKQNIFSFIWMANFYAGGDF